MKGLARPLALALIAGAGGQAALAAGGHHAVDDAGILEPGECELETWGTRAQGGERLLHGGGACRVGPIELGAAAEYARDHGASATAYGLEAKWAREVAEGFSLGLVVAPAWQARTRPRYQGAALVGLATWEPRDDLALHLNLGRDFAHRGRDENRFGVAAEWTPRQGWSLLAERYRAEATHFVRAGVRWAAGRNWSVDLSRAQRLSGPAPSNWTLGLTLGLGVD
ncbi:hypothetical protein [Ramlibacter tataouinensis]|uniref:Uncharacterized protein n=1 Tax=Ramlibacter tataouinensis (strain ATCC BAA-407 / DSM 14655 / LMG 21543 / TTB310) TaxID=365046 RepID=F5Y404_RAMTT|nr:hypothetical protein [Ramlibacter tataouinensis]AEG91282.1 Hypothetical protein Rta_02180 [Ramlibacter tataouinensis TTB310]